MDVFARRIVGWRVSNRRRSDLALEALEPARCAHQITDGLVHHRDRGSQYLAIGYTQRLAAAIVETSVSRVGNAYDHAMAETVIGRVKTELIRKQGPWHRLEQLDHATLGLGRRVQPAASLGAAGLPVASRTQAALLRRPTGLHRGGCTQTTEPPEKPGRFKRIADVTEPDLGQLFAVSFYSGFRDVVRDELQEVGPAFKLKTTLLGKRHDFLVFTSAVDATKLLHLRSAENAFVLCCLIDGIPTHRVRGLELVEHTVASARIGDCLQALARCRGIACLSDSPDWRFTVQLQGYHKFSADEVHKLSVEVLTALPALGKRRNEAEVDLRLQIIRDKGFLGLQLPRKAMNKRPYKALTRAGSLDPTVAYSLIRLTKPELGDTFLDPMCGAGTIPIEARLGFRLGAVICGDEDSQAVHITERNASTAETELAVHQWNALHLPLANETVDTIATNLPYGKDVPLDNPGHFLRALLSELARVMRIEGRAALLTAHGNDLDKLVRSGSTFRITSARTLNLYCRAVALLVLERGISRRGRKASNRRRPHKAIDSDKK